MMLVLSHMLVRKGILVERKVDMDIPQIQMMMMMMTMTMMMTYLMHPTQEKKVMLERKEDILLDHLILERKVDMDIQILMDHLILDHLIPVKKEVILAERKVVTDM